MLKSIESLEGLQEKNFQELQVGILENQTLMDGIHANSVPQSSSDSRKLLENTLVEKLTPPQQNHLFAGLGAMVQEAIFDCEKMTQVDVDAQEFYKGIKCSLKQILFDLDTKNDLYYLKTKYENIVGRLSEIKEEFSDTFETNFFGSKIKGIVSGFSNFISILSTTLVEEENSLYRIQELQPLR